MDEVFSIIKQQLDTESIQQAKTLMISKHKKPKKAQKNQEPDTKSCETSKTQKIGTFGTSKRKVFLPQSNPVDFIGIVDRPYNRVSGGYISKVPRNKQSKPESSPQLILNPNFEFLAKKHPTPILSRKPYKKAETKAKKTEGKEYSVNQSIDIEIPSVSTADSEFDQFFKAKLL